MLALRDITATRVLTWSPPESPLRIEYSPELLRGLHSGGVLFGVRSKAMVRIVSTHASRTLEPVGVFAARVRGEVFLTESDLERLETQGGSVALVIAGKRAGFFVHDKTGAIQSIKSYQEFSVPLK